MQRESLHAQPCPVLCVDCQTQACKRAFIVRSIPFLFFFSFFSFFSLFPVPLHSAVPTAAQQCRHLSDESADIDPATMIETGTFSALQCCIFVVLIANLDLCRCLNAVISLSLSLSMACTVLCALCTLACASFSPSSLPPSPLLSLPPSVSVSVSVFSVSLFVRVCVCARARACACVYLFPICVPPPRRPGVLRSIPSFETLSTNVRVLHLVPLPFFIVLLFHGCIGHGCLTPYSA